MMKRFLILIIVCGLCMAPLACKKDKPSETGTKKAESRAVENDELASDVEDSEDYDDSTDFEAKGIPQEGSDEEGNQMGKNFAPPLPPTE